MKKFFAVAAFAALTTGAFAQTDVADLAAANATADSTEIRITGTVVVISGTNGLNQSSTLRHQYFVQDATGALLVDDASYIMGADVAIGDEITNLTVTMGTYYGTRQGVPSSAPNISVGTGTVPAAHVVGGSDVLDDLLSSLIEVQGCAISETGTFASNTSYDLTTAVGPIAQIRVEEGSTLIGETIPSSFNLVGVCTQYSSTGQVQPRLAADLTDTSSSVSDWSLF